MDFYMDKQLQHIEDSGDFLINEAYYVMRNLQKSFAESFRAIDEIEDIYTNGVKSKYVYQESVLSSITKIANNAWGYFIKILTSIINYGLKAVSFILDIIKRVFGIELKVNIIIDGENVVKTDTAKTTYGKLLSGMNLSASLKEINKTLPDFTKLVISDNDVLDPLPIINEIIAKTKAGKLEIATDSKNANAVDKLFKDAIDAVLTYSKVGDNRDIHKTMGNVLHDNKDTVKDATAIYDTIIKAMHVADDEFINCVKEVRTYVDSIMKSAMKDLDKSKVSAFITSAVTNASITDVYDDILSGKDADMSKLNFFSLFAGTTVPNTDLNGTLKTIFSDTTTYTLHPERYLKYMSKNTSIKEVVSADFDRNTATNTSDIGFKNLCTNVLAVLMNGPNSSNMADLYTIITTMKTEMQSIISTSTNTSKVGVAKKILDTIDKLPSNVLNMRGVDIVPVLDVLREYGAMNNTISKVETSVSGNTTVYKGSGDLYECKFTTQSFNSPVAMITNSNNTNPNYAQALEKLHVFLTEVKKSLTVEYNGIKSISSKEDIANGIHPSLSSDMKLRDAAIQAMRNTVTGYQAELNNILNISNGILKSMVVLQGVKVNNNLIKIVPALEIYGKMSNTFYQLLLKLEKYTKPNTPEAKVISANIQSAINERNNKYKGVSLI